MKTTGLITRRRAIITGLASVGGLILTRYPKDLPPTYGMKYLQRIVVADEFDDGGKKGNIQNGWAWYTGI